MELVTYGIWENTAEDSLFTIVMSYIML